MPAFSWDATPLSYLRPHLPSNVPTALPPPQENFSSTHKPLHQRLPSETSTLPSPLSSPSSSPTKTDTVIKNLCPPPPPPPYTRTARVNDKKSTTAAFFSTSPGATYSSATSTVSAAAAAILSATPFYTPSISRSSSLDRCRGRPSLDEDGQVTDDENYIGEQGCDVESYCQSDRGETWNGGSGRREELKEYVVPVNNLIDPVAIQAAVGLANRALTEDRRGNRASATDLYLAALESMLLALPVEADTDRKEALQKKLSEYLHASNMTLQPVTAQSVQSNANSLNGTKVSDKVISVAVKAAVALKQSPLPDLMGVAANYALRKAQQVDEMFGVQEKAWQVGKSAINKGIELDREYHVHHKLADAAFIGAAALLKASIAYKDAKPYRELHCED